MPILSEDFLRRTSLGDRAERVYRDSKLPGFALRLRRKVDGSLSKSFFIFQELPSKDGTRRRRKIAIGDHPTFPAEKAREVAQSMLQAIKVGDDPAAARAERKAQPLFEELADEFERSYLPQKKPATRKDYAGRIRRLLKPYFKERRVVDITSAMVRDFHRKHRDHPTDANRALAVLSVMMACAVEWNWRPDNPAKGVKRNAEIPRDHWLDETDLPKFIEVLAKAEGPNADIIRFLTVTGWRISEARYLTWDMVDLPRLVARLPDTKTGASVRALSTDAATVIDKQPLRAGFVFSQKGTAPLNDKDIRAELAAICERAEIAPITPHVLRHTAATWAAISGAQAHELREAFGWKTLAMTARYVSRSEMLARRGAQRAADAINIFGKPSADVRDINR